VLLGAVLVAVCFPKRREEQELLARFHAEDTEAAESSQARHRVVA
jgi:hypothetical protein